MRILFYFRAGESIAIEILSSLLKQAGHETGLIYEPGLDHHFATLPFAKSVNEMEKRRAVKKARAFQPDLLAFSSSTFMYPHSLRMARLLKAETGAPTIIGGVHAWALPEQVLGDGFDIVCLGEGEGALLELVARLEEGKGSQDIQNLWMKDENGKIIKNPVRPLIADLDSLPYMDKKLFFDQGAIFHRLEFITTRDCPYNCSFCINSVQNQTYPSKRKVMRRRSVESAIDELKLHKALIHPWGGYFFDDIFALDTDWLEEFCRRYEKEIGVSFACQIHPNLVTPSVCRILKKAGCYVVDMGVQTGREYLRNKLGRRESNELIQTACKTAKAEGLALCLHWIFGLPRETPESMWDTYEFARELKSRYNYTTLLVPSPGTQIFEECRDLGLMDKNAIKKIMDGKSSFHKDFVLNHPHRDVVVIMKYLLPIFVKLPAFLANPILRWRLRKPYGLDIKLLGTAGVPLMDFKLALERSLEILHTLWFQFRPKRDRSRN